MASTRRRGREPYCGLVLGLYTVAQIRAAEQVLLAATPDGALMQRAASGLAMHCAALLTDARGRIPGASVTVLVGSGNNGGDALYAGARLSERGAVVTAVTLSDSPHPAGLRALLDSGGTVVDASAAAGAEVLEAVSTSDMVLDGIVGLGGTGPLRPVAAELARAARSSGLSVAVDMPSGIDPDTGWVADSQACFHADVTVTFGALKVGLAVDPAASLCGTVQLVDIGLGPVLDEQVPRPDVRLVRLSDAGEWVDLPGPLDNKYSRGVVGIAAASERYPGAAIMACGSARLGGAGMVHYAGSASADVIRAWPEVISSPEWPNDHRITAWGIGPGWAGSGPGLPAESAMASAAVHDVRPLLMDAGALTLLAEDAELRQAVRARERPTVLTPHDGEFARLAGSAPGPPGRIVAAQQLAAQLGVVVLLKGAGTVVATPAGDVYVARSAPPELATAGSGDVLSGLLSSMLASAEARSEADGDSDSPGIDDDVAARVAAAAATVHGTAGRIAVETQGVITAMDLISALPAALLTAHDMHELDLQGDDMHEHDMHGDGLQGDSERDREARR